MGHGVSIHTQECKKYKEALQRGDPEELARWIPAQWASNAPAAEMQVKIEVLCVNRMGLLNDITAALSEAHIPVSNFNFHMLKSGNAMLEATVSVGSREVLTGLLAKLQTIRDVISAERAAY